MMKDVEEQRKRAAAAGSQTENNNTFFLLLIILIPLTGLAAGLVYTSLSQPAAPPHTTEHSGPGEQQADIMPSQLSKADKWLLMKARDRSGLAVALSMKENYPDIYRREVYKAVSSTLGLCATDYKAVKDYRFVSQNYRQVNKPVYLQLVRKIENSPAEEEFKMRVRRGAMAELASGKFHKDLHAAIEREIETFGQHIPASGSGECQMVKTLAQQAQFNITS